jgi:hypothetical protein
VGPTASGETPSLPRTRPAASICRIDGSDRRALPQLTRESRGPGTPLNLTVRSRRRGPTPPLPPLPPPRVPDKGHFPDDSTPLTLTPTGPPEGPPAGSPPKHALQPADHPPENYHRSNGNDGSRHHGAAASSVSPARRSARANDDRSAGRPTVPRRDASPAAPTPEGEANPDGERCPPVCPARRDTSGLGAKTNLPGSSNTPAGRRRVQCTTRDVVPKNFLLVVRPPTDRRTPFRCAVTDPRTSPGLNQVCAMKHIVSSNLSNN